MPDTEGRPGGIGMAAAVLSLLICFGAVCLIGAIGVLFLHNPLVPRIAVVRIILASFDLIVLLFLVWSAATVVGLFRLRSWARPSIIAIGVIDFIVFAVFCGIMIRARFTPIVIGLDAHPNPAMPFPVGAMLLALAAIYGAVALIGLWWAVYFNLSPVRLAFNAAKIGLPPGTSTRLTP
jgi:hypothetical protein